MDKSYIKLYRELIKKPIWLNSTPEHKSIIITLLLLANHRPAEWEWCGKKFKVNRGQFVTSLESIRRKTGKGISIQNIRSCLKRLKKLKFATNKATKSGRLITIINWDSYQPKIKKATKIVTNEQQRSNKGATPNKNNKNNKNNKKEEKDIKKKTSFKTYLKEKIIQHNFIESKDKILEFYLYRMVMPAAQRYKTEKGINGLFRDLEGCRKAGMVVSDCLEEAMEREWKTPNPSYFKNSKQKNKHNNYQSRSDSNKQACVDFVNEMEAKL